MHVFSDPLWEQYNVDAYSSMRRQIFNENSGSIPFLKLHVCSDFLLLPQLLIMHRSEEVQYVVLQELYFVSNSNCV